eukprot:TRINITY_DN36111_c0_g1_i1.p2 TRINITY_DN36111_c0_g1~~TRINITY_DN36111_c0_g1_i1.p2  ORF type:complete len:240 (-),score=59.66 TRINITY_DN36111_c0_g1_i1:100-819(-)
MVLRAFRAGLLPLLLQLVAGRVQPLIVGIAGGSGSGKSYIAETVEKFLGSANVSTVAHDWYYKDLSHLSAEERDAVNFDHPDALDSSLMLEQLQQLKAGDAIDAPVYDFATHTRLQQKKNHVSPAPLVLVDGILTLADPRLAEMFDVRIFVDTPADLRLLRRIRRDVVERGRSTESVLDQYETTVRPMHELFVEPAKAVADHVVSGEGALGTEQIVQLLAGYIRPEGSSTSDGSCSSSI